MALSLEILEAQAGREFDSARREIIETYLLLNSLMARLIRLREDALRAAACGDPSAGLKAEHVQEYGAQVTLILSRVYLEKQP